MGKILERVQGEASTKANHKPAVEFRASEACRPISPQRITLEGIFSVLRTRRVTAPFDNIHVDFVNLQTSTHNRKQP